jgi:hypothetical protein
MRKVTIAVSIATRIPDRSNLTEIIFPLLSLHKNAVNRLH